MTTDTQMNIDERYKYLRIQQRSYAAAQTRRAKQALLDELERVTGLHRKHLIQLLGQASIQRHPRSRERERTYGAAMDEALALIWEAQDYICAERLQPVVVFTAEQLAGFGRLSLGPGLRQQLGQISRQRSVGTCRRCRWGT